MLVNLSRESVVPRGLLPHVYLALLLSKDAFDDLLIDWVGLWLSQAESLHHVVSLYLLAFLVVVDELLKVPLGGADCALCSLLVDDPVNLILLLLGLDGVVVEEVDKVSLVGFHYYFTTEGIDSELLDNLQQINLFIELLLCIPKQPVLSLTLMSATETAWV